MGLNIGIRVKQQQEEYMSSGRNPKGTSEQIKEALYAQLVQKFPEPNGFGLSVTVGKEYDFDVRFSHYTDAFTARGYEMHDLYLALISYALENFSADYGIEMHVYYSP